MSSRCRTDGCTNWAATGNEYCLEHLSQRKEIGKASLPIEHTTTSYPMQLTGANNLFDRCSDATTTFLKVDC
ncbi:hypothetical protein HBH92_149030 [Parastagonospora nodorum]|nr:hypothetical protein HBI03_087800 [Parastagonospora nodorum]KAH4278720.1 hypothetical protein HBI04_084560 [Parastagonospora nodorum]KAH4408749.1 hypothetical protein HBH92_149030 [Parastagonospora nodorum]KAH4435307.1 hypothetical protein HBH93_114130 [Parastagonospora nodorum]KAH4447414.1 hypothetical protein HBH91_134290 [Parastagonospora nodorum]